MFDELLDRFFKRLEQQRAQEAIHLQKQAEIARLAKLEADEIERHRLEESSPEFQRRRALHDFTGGSR